MVVVPAIDRSVGPAMDPFEHQVGQRAVALQLQLGGRLVCTRCGQYMNPADPGDPAKRLLRDRIVHQPRLGRGQVPDRFDHRTGLA